MILILFGVTFFGWATAALASLFASMRPEAEITVVLGKQRQQAKELQEGLDHGDLERPPSREQVSCQ